MKEIRSVSNFK
jgi:hypothetical protein